MRKDRLEGTLSTPSFRRPITREPIDNTQARYDNIIESDTNRKSVKVLFMIRTFLRMTL